MDRENKHKHQWKTIHVYRIRTKLEHNFNEVETIQNKPLLTFYISMRHRVQKETISNYTPNYWNCTNHLTRLLMLLSVKSTVASIIRRAHSSQCQSSLKMAESYILPEQVYVGGSTMFRRTNKPLPLYSGTAQPHSSRPLSSWEGNCTSSHEVLTYLTLSINKRLHCAVEWVDYCTGTKVSSHM